MNDAVIISVVAPCYNEGEVVRLFCQRMLSVLSQIPGEHEIILVDDGSSDATWDIICDESSKNRVVSGIRLSRNHGHQLAITAGLNAADGEYILTIDADLQDPPELLPEMLKICQQGANVCFGQRRSRKGTPLLKKLSYLLFYRVLSLLADCEIQLDSGDFRLFDRRVLEILRSMPEQHRFLRGMISWMGFDQRPLIYDRDARAGGEPKYTFRKLLNLAIDGIMSFSIKPLRLGIFLSIACAIGALGMIVYLVFGALFIQSAPKGWSSLMIVILLCSSANLLMLGILGEYLGRIFLQTKDRPMVLIRSTVNR